MAYAALVSLLQTSEQILESDPYFLPCTRENFESSQQNIASLISFLDDCSPICDQTINKLIRKIRDAAYEAEDVLESLIATHFLHKYGSDRHEKLKKFPQSLEEVIENMGSMVKEVKKIQRDGSGVHERVISVLASSSRPASRGNNSMVALDNDLEIRILEQLVGGQSTLDIVPIVGMGGIGKTTLATILFNSQLIKESFEIRALVTISQTYNVHEVVLGILKDIGVPLDGKKNGEQNLYQSLYDRKYLIVLDDVWSTKACDDIKMLFPDNYNSSRIVLTTRHSEVAAYANSFSSYHEMKLLDDGSSWRLLCKEIFSHKDCPYELVEIGKAIAIRCQGLPLAISVIGGHLRKECMTKDYWKYVFENLNSVLRTTDDQILEILSLSYKYLPHHLKACFLYVGLFPRYYGDIKVASMIQLWVAEGFVQQSRSNCVEVVAMRYLQDLIDRNLIFVRQYDSFEAPKFCGIHDLLKDICTREAQKENFICVLNSYEPFCVEESNSQRCLFIDPNILGDDYDDDDDDDDDDSGDFALIDGSGLDGETSPGTGDSGYFALADRSDSDDEASPGTGSDGENLENADVLEYNGDSDDDGEGRESIDSSEKDGYLRSVVTAMPLIRSFIYVTGGTSSILRLISGLLKVLYVGTLENNEFPVQVLELVSLRYLELGYVNQVPPSISRLWNLQTIIIRTVDVITLPLEVWEMPQLRHLQIYHFHLPEVLNFQVRETETRDFKGLQTLSYVTNFRCTEEVLPRILNLKRLNMRFTDDTNDWSFYGLNNLVRLCELESLLCMFYVEPNETLARDIVFPTSLKKLVLDGSGIPWDKMTIIGMLPNLEVLKLKNGAFEGPLWEPNEDEFTQLKYLSIESSWDLKEWRAEDFHFPRLRHLLLRQCSALEAIPSGIGEIPTLEIIELHLCGLALESSAREMLGEESEIKLIVVNSL